MRPFIPRMLARRGNDSGPIREINIKNLKKLSCIRGKKGWSHSSFHFSGGTGDMALQLSNIWLPSPTNSFHFCHSHSKPKASHAALAASSLSSPAPTIQVIFGPSIQFYIYYLISYSYHKYANSCLLMNFGWKLRKIMIGTSVSDCWWEEFYLARKFKFKIRWQLWGLRIRARLGRSWCWS